MSLSLSEWMGVVHTPEMEWPRGNVRQFQLKTPEKLCFSSDRNFRLSILSLVMSLST
jgi:hypothetical protein